MTADAPEPRQPRVETSETSPTAATRPRDDAVGFGL
jgi:hypothetical protein